MQIGSLVKNRHIREIGIVTHVYGSDLFSVLFANGRGTFTVERKDLEVISDR